MAEVTTETGTPDAGATNDPKPSTIILPSSGGAVVPGGQGELPLAADDASSGGEQTEEAPVLGHGGKEIPAARIAERVARERSH